MKKLSLRDVLEKRSEAEVHDIEPFYQRPVSATIGRVRGLGKMLLGSTAPVRPSASKETLGDFLADIKDDSEHPVAVYLGSGRPLENLSRVWNNPRTSVASKLLGTVASPLSDIGNAFSRGESYNPYAHSVTLHDDDPEFLAHELGHAHDFSNRKNPVLDHLLTGLPLVGTPLEIQQEYEATKRGLVFLKKYYEKKFGGDKDKVADAMKNANRKLAAALGSYVGGAFGAPLEGLAAGHLVGYNSDLGSAGGPSIGEDWGNPS